MAVHHRLEMLSDAMRRADVPAGRTVVMAAGLSPAVGIGTRDLDHAAIGEKCRFHAFPCCLRQRKPVMLSAQG